MNNPNPLIPKGSLMDQQAKGSPHLRVALFIVVVHLIFLGGLLMQGCKKEDVVGDQAKAPEQEPVEAETLDMEKIFGESSRPEPEPDPQLGRTLGGQSNQLSAFRRTPVVVSNTPPERVIPQRPIEPEEQNLELEPMDPDEPEESVVPQETQPAVVQHTIARGDSFYSLSRRYKVSVAAIVEANSTLDPAKLAVGAVVHIPVGAPGAATTTEVLPAGVTVYEVKKGDTLTGIARESGTTVQKLKELNGMNRDRINVGQTLKVPSGAGNATRAN